MHPYVCLECYAYRIFVFVCLFVCLFVLLLMPKHKLFIFFCLRKIMRFQNPPWSKRACEDEWGSEYSACNTDAQVNMHAPMIMWMKWLWCYNTYWNQVFHIFSLLPGKNVVFAADNWFAINLGSTDRFVYFILFYFFFKGIEQKKKKQHMRGLYPTNHNHIGRSISKLSTPTWKKYRQFIFPKNSKMTLKLQ